jgi:uncharacterized protein
MTYVIYTRDKSDHGHVRDAHRAAHRAYLAERSDVVWASGGLFEEGADRAGGGLIIVDLESRADAEAFVLADPFARAGLFEHVDVWRWKRTIYLGKQVST